MATLRSHIDGMTHDLLGIPVDHKNQISLPSMFQIDFCHIDAIDFIGLFSSRFGPIRDSFGFEFGLCIHNII